MRKAFDSSLSESAYQRIRDKILKGEYSLGMTLSRRMLSSEFGMSLLPISEALQRLESDGLVESKPRVGTRVKIPTCQEIRGHYIVREALESQAARLFAEKASPGERREVHAMAERLDQMYRNAAQGDADLYALHRLHARLHMRIAECSGCEPLCSAIEKNQVLVFNWLYDIASERRKLPARWHQSLVAALSTGDVLKADEAMRRHVSYGMEEVLKHLELTPEPASWRQTLTRKTAAQQAGG
jgi:DNA-binding GntR family transcriptional regulator